MKPLTGAIKFILILLLGLLAMSVEAAGDLCFICNKQIRATYFTKTDRVTEQKVFMCSECTELPKECYLCTLPVLRDFLELPDGRVFCKRDAKTVVTDDEVAARICEQVKQGLDRQFIRFLTFPDTNVTLQLMDRITLQEMFNASEFRCPNVTGCTVTKTNAGQLTFSISLMSGQPREEMMTTCVHEYTHTWIRENVSTARLKTIGPDAVEGFCELLSYLFAEEQGLRMAKTNILNNRYTRGQIHRFIAAYRTYGLQDIVDWMKQGEDALLRDDLSRVRRLAEPTPLVITAKIEPGRKTNGLLVVATDKAALPVMPVRKLPEKLQLQGIVWSRTRPLATINGRNFSPQESQTIQLRDAVVTVRCMEIRPTAVVLQTNAAPDLLVLELK